jgi:hypothetical protein
MTGKPDDPGHQGNPQRPGGVPPGPPDGVPPGPVDPPVPPSRRVG